MTTFRLPTRRGLTRISACALLLLGACASNPPVIQRYTLPQLDRSYAPLPDAVDAVTVQLNPVIMADHLDSRGLLYQRSAITISEAGKHVWAENIRDQLSRAMRLELSTLLQPLQVIDALQMQAADTRDYQLSIQVEQFQGQHDGYAVVSGLWSLRDAEGRLLEITPYRLQRPLGEDGYPALVRSLDEAWRTLAVDIGRSLQARDARLTARP